MYQTEDAKKMSGLDDIVLLLSPVTDAAHDADHDLDLGEMILDLLGPDNVPLSSSSSETLDVSYLWTHSTRQSPQPIACVETPLTREESGSDASSPPHRRESKSHGETQVPHDTTFVPQGNVNGGFVTWNPRPDVHAHFSC